MPSEREASAFNPQTSSLPQRPDTTSRKSTLHVLLQNLKLVFASSQNSLNVIFAICNSQRQLDLSVRKSTQKGVMRTCLWFDYPGGRRIESYPDNLKLSRQLAH